jgi:hypothetical protein
VKGTKRQGDETARGRNDRGRRNGKGTKRPVTVYTIKVSVITVGISAYVNSKF